MLSKRFTIVLFAEVGTQWNTKSEPVERSRARSVAAAVVKCAVGGARHAAPPSPFTAARPRRPASPTFRPTLIHHTAKYFTTTSRCSQNRASPRALPHRARNENDAYKTTDR